MRVVTLSVYVGWCLWRLKRFRMCMGGIVLGATGLRENLSVRQSLRVRRTWRSFLLLRMIFSLVRVCSPVVILLIQSLIALLVLLVLVCATVYRRKLGCDFGESLLASPMIHFSLVRVLRGLVLCYRVVWL